MMERTKGFTLVELLVVVAIIALLVSILLPSLGKAKEQTRTVMCLTNLKGLNLAFVFYAQDNDEWYPAGSSSDGAPTWDYILRDFYQQFGLLHCPSDRADRTKWYEDWGTPKEEQYPRSFAINRNVSFDGPPTPWPGGVHKASDVTDPGETILLGEMWDATYWGSTPNVPGMYNRYTGCAIFYGYNESNPGRNREASYNVHNNNDRANYLFCGGHVITIMSDDPNLHSTSEYYYWTRVKQ